MLHALWLPEIIIRQGQAPEPGPPATEVFTSQIVLTDERIAGIVAGLVPGIPHNQVMGANLGGVS